MQELYWKRAEENRSSLFEKVIVPETPQQVLERGSEITLDLGNHYVGYLSFRLDWVEEYLDAPVRLYVKFCETERELQDDFSAYKGSLCASWLQDEVLNLDDPGEYHMPRRYAARYIRLRVLQTPRRLCLSHFSFRAVTSADTGALKPANLSDDTWKKIDAVAVNTLKNCMQHVFEDGPKRDRRLWIGDLRLEALANYVTFRNLPLVRRCLYLFAAAKRNAYGFLPSHLYERPGFVSGTWYLVDYALLFVVSACDYLQHTGDEATFRELLPVIRTQMEAAHGMLDERGIVSPRPGCDVFIDWCEGLQKMTALQGVYLYTLIHLCAALRSLGLAEADVYAERLQKAQAAARAELLDEKSGRAINARDGFQYSVHSAAWMVLGEVVTGEAAAKLLSEALRAQDSVKAFTPYMHHYIVEALVKAGERQFSFDYMRSFWGEMVARGADTFFEVFVPSDPDFSPYGDRQINSMCHAWSCTPTYFIRMYGIPDASRNS